MAPLPPPTFGGGWEEGSVQDAEPRGPAGTSRPVSGVGGVPTVEPRRAWDPGAPSVKVGHTLYPQGLGDTWAAAYGGVEGGWGGCPPCTLRG